MCIRFFSSNIILWFLHFLPCWQKTIFWCTGSCGSQDTILFQLLDKKFSMLYAYHSTFNMLPANTRIHNNMLTVTTWKYRSKQLTPEYCKPSFHILIWLCKAVLQSQSSFGRLLHALAPALATEPAQAQSEEIKHISIFCF